MPVAEMERRYGIWLGVLLLVVIVFIISLIRWSHRAGFSAGDPYSAVPTDVYMLIEAGDMPALMRKFVRENRIWDDLKKIPDIERASRNLEIIDSLFSGNRDFYNLFQGSELLLSLHNAGKSGTAVLGVLRMPARLREAGLHRMVLEVRKGKVSQIRIYNHVKIYQVQLVPDRLEFYFAVHKGLLLFSPSRILLEKGIRQMETQTAVNKDPSFRKVWNTAGKNEEANIYIRADRIPGVLKRWVSDGMYRKTKRAFPLGGWTELDVVLREKSVLLNGFTVIDDTTGYLLRIPGANEPAPADIMEIIPASTVSATVLTFGDMRKYQKRLQIYRQGKKTRPWADVAGSFQKIMGQTPGDFFSSFVTGQAALVNMDIKNETDANNTFWVTRVKSRSNATQALKEIIKEYARKNNNSSRQYITTVSFDPGTKYTVYRLPFEYIPGLIFGRMAGEYPYQYITFLENYMLAGNSVKSIFSYIRFIVLQQTLSHDPDFREFTEGMSMRSNLFYFLKIPESDRLIGKFFSGAVKKSFARYHEKNIKIKYLGYEAIYQNSMIYNNIFIQYKDKVEKKALTVWESLLDTVINYKPQIVINHRTRQKEIFVQDAANHIYLINASGRILWKVPLGEKILGQAWQIDFYKNNKLQYLFNTHHYLYLIDRNGNFVERFPVALRSPASNAMALFDYDKNKNYRIFIAGEDKKVYVYDKQGNLVPGWKIPKSESPVTEPVHHYTWAGKDYIVFSDTLNLYVFDRRGNVRLHVKENIPKPVHQSIFWGRYPGTGSPAIVVNSTGGKIYFVSLTGKIRHVQFSNIPEDAWFYYEDLDGDDREEYLFVYGNQLCVMRSTAKELFTFRIKGMISCQPVVYTFSSRDKKTGLVDATHGLIYLVNNNGKLYNGFPLKGRTRFTIGRLGPTGNNFNLITGGEDNFLYNYSVNVKQTN
ncbi:MAG TPA: hypothetical protein ENK25_00635 [Bacteroidetes bacterium]|nr:hypothetical protein [Bacteroidota bacterium]